MTQTDAPLSDTPVGHDIRLREAASSGTPR